MPYRPKGGTHVALQYYEDSRLQQRDRNGNAAGFVCTYTPPLSVHGAGGFFFEKARMSIKKRLVVVGNGMVGQRFLETVLAGNPGFSTQVFGAESRAAYDRVHLSSLFSGATPEDLSVVPSGFFEREDVQLHLGQEVLGIDRDSRTVRTAGGKVSYDALVLATGSYAFVPDVPGKDREGCYAYRTIEDVDAIRAGSQGAQVGVVIGGGLLGLEAAKALKDLGLETHVVEFAPRLMALQVDEPGGSLLRRRIEELGVRVHVAKSTRAIVEGETTRHKLEFADGTTLAADVVVFSAGIRPSDSLARECGLTLGPRGGIAIDDACRTSDPSIYAIGECALWNGRIFGLVAPGYRMAQVAAAHILAEHADEAPAAAPPLFTGADMSTKLKLLGVEVASLGDCHAASPGARSYAFIDERRQVYKKLVVDGEGRRVLGAVLVGDAASFGEWQQMMLNDMPLPESPEDLLLPPREGGKPAGAGIAALPESATLCSCNNVTKGDLCRAIEGGCTTMAGLKDCTRAATTCGGCAPLVTQVLKAELARQGLAFDNTLCEHFPFSRQQLFHLVKVGSIKSFEDLLARHGKGLGCDICKPAVASILASCWNGFVLGRGRAQLQDTNDYFLANMQKDGTYSVVPRIPGGEITPEKLIVIGTVAQRYGLYTKITGGQRIDLFGARVHQLPQIWGELVAAGFESGHAYGKAMRTVKSCVGSTWCRYGVQDSVGMAIRLENRYRGLRAPHKIKLAVSGCTRECAEAQSKDIGVIATERGWNLYVCGNGGVKPRHADLFATDLDDATLIRYIDRVLMFYIRTADRLQRTATWLDNLEGGLEYLQQVVREDSLGIGAELEADMAGIVATYECEWKKAIDDPQTLARFRHFVNSEAEDEGVVFEQERGQIRPRAVAVTP